MTDIDTTLPEAPADETNGVSAAPKRRARRAPGDAAAHATLSVTAPPSPLGALRTAIADAILHRKRLAGELSALDAELATAGITLADKAAREPSAIDVTAAAPPKPARKARKPRAAKAAAEPSALLTDIVAHLRAHEGGQRAEEIRAAIGFEKADVTKALKEGLKAKLLTKSGEKRATVYRAK